MYRGPCLGICLAVLVLSSFATVAPADSLLYVDVDAPPGGDGSSWAEAFVDLQVALAAAPELPGPVEVRVAQGTYRPTSGSDRTRSFSLIEEVAIKGGYAGFGEPDPDERDIAARETILSGDIGVPGDDADNSYHVVVSTDVFFTAVLDGFTITAGNADETTPGGGFGAGLHSLNGNPTISSCTFKDNAAAEGGGGLYVYGDGATVSHCVFSNNSAAMGGGVLSVHAGEIMTHCVLSGNSAEEGGGMANLHGGPFLIHCEIIGNTASVRGGGMYNFWYNGEITMTHCTLAGNSAPQGGGMYNDGYFVAPELTGCLFAGNVAEQNGGAIYHDTSTSLLTHCTFCGNEAGGGYGGGLYNPSEAWQPILANSILWANRDAAGIGDYAQIYGGAPAVDYSCIQGPGGEWDGIGNINDDPAFVGGSSGTWTAVATYDPATDWTTFVDASASWADGELADALVNPDVAQSLQSLIATNTATTITVWGDFALLGTPGTAYQTLDYHLTADSPCVDTGDPDFAPMPDAADIDGEPRIMACRVEMGVDELTAGPPTPGDFNRDGVVDLADVPLFAQALLAPTLADTCAGDMTADGELNGADIQPFIDALLGA